MLVSIHKHFVAAVVFFFFFFFLLLFFVCFIFKLEHSCLIKDSFFLIFQNFNLIEILIL